jgi:hypothetical protein
MRHPAPDTPGDAPILGPSEDLTAWSFACFDLLMTRSVRTLFFCATVVVVAGCSSNGNKGTPAIPGTVLATYPGTATGTLKLTADSDPQNPGSVSASVVVSQTDTGYVVTGQYTRKGLIFSCSWDAKATSETELTLTTPTSCPIDLSETEMGGVCDSGTIVVDAGLLTFGVSSGTATLQLKGTFGACTGGAAYALTFSGKK